MKPATTISSTRFPNKIKSQKIVSRIEKYSIKILYYAEAKLKDRAQSDAH